MAWWFGRTIVELDASAVKQVAGSDTLTIVADDRSAGPPLIEPIAAPAPAGGRFRPPLAHSAPQLPDGPALILGHAEPSPSDLSQVRCSGRLSAGEFIVGRRTRELDRPAGAASWDDAVRHSESLNAASKAAIAELGRLADHSR